MRRSVFCALLGMLGCTGSSSGSGPNTTIVLSPRDECAQHMRRAVACADTFVPAWAALRVRLDVPSGTAAQHASLGHEAMLAALRRDFAQEWSEPSIATICADLAVRPVSEREAIMGPERACLREPDCERYVACDMRNRERRWTTRR